MSEPNAAMEVAAAAIREWRTSGNIWHATVPVAAAIIAAREEGRQSGYEEAARDSRAVCSRAGGCLP